MVKGWVPAVRKTFCHELDHASRLLSVRPAVLHSASRARQARSAFRYGEDGPPPCSSSPVCRFRTSWFRRTKRAKNTPKKKRHPQKGTTDPAPSALSVSIWIPPAMKPRSMIESMTARKIGRLSMTRRFGGALVFMGRRLGGRRPCINRQNCGLESRCRLFAGAQKNAIQRKIPFWRTENGGTLMNSGRRSAPPYQVGEARHRVRRGAEGTWRASCDGDPSRRRARKAAGGSSSSSGHAPQKTPRRRATRRRRREGACCSRAGHG